MRRKFNQLAVLFVMVCLSCLAVGQVARPQRVQILETGEGFHGDEIKARSGERWLGLYVTKGASILIESKLRIRRVVDVVVDEKPGQMTGKAVGVDQPGKPIFLVKDAPMLRPGKVVTIFRANSEYNQSLGERKQMSLKLGGQIYQLKVVAQSRQLGTDTLTDGKLFLIAGKTQQLLRRLGAGHNDPPAAYWELLWAGDLDGDGKLDLYADLTGHYNLSQRKLFLSSQAKPGQLVAEVGGFRTSGC